MTTKKTAKRKTLTVKKPEVSNKDKRAIKEKKVRRHAVGRNASHLAIIGEKDPNFNYRIANATDTRINELKSYGYEIDQSPDLQIGSANPEQTGSAHSAVVDRGTGQKAVIMRQPIDYQKEDKGLRAKAIDKTEESMFRNIKTEEGRYGGVEKSDSLARKVED